MGMFFLFRNIITKISELNVETKTDIQSIDFPDVGSETKLLIK